MRVKEETYIRLGEECIHKLDVVASAVEEPTTQKQLVEGGIDDLFSNALRFLYRDGEITKECLEDQLEMLEDWQAERTWEQIEEDLNKKSRE